MRVKGGPQGHLRHKKVLKITKGQRGTKHRLFKRANEAMLKSLWYATRDRRVRKRDLRKLWIVRINAAARLNGTTYSKLTAALKKANIELNRRMLADMAVQSPDLFRLVLATLNGDLTTNAPPPFPLKGSDTIYCLKCGSPNPSEANFCSKCGSQLEKKEKKKRN